MEQIKGWVKKNQGIIKLTVIFAIVLGAICLIMYQPMMDMLKDPQAFKQQLESYGIWGQAIMVALMAAQVAFAFLPGEIIEVMAGVIFGSMEGLALCLIGAGIGSCLIYWFVDKLGMRFIERFVSKEKIESLKFMLGKKNLPIIIFILFFIPGTPKDLMTYVMPLTSMKLSTFLAISTVARIPSVITSTFAGDSLMQNNIYMAVAVFVITGIVSLGGILAYQHFIKSQNKKAEQIG